ncbi:VWA domain-containing protein [Lysinibacillus sp. 3P01SB]|uniref:VWA domain-containing protein n=1 Tax=Lysinibacillus sp. 3P01SB TaxID=3132284 RepID=UPI0039A67C81
MKKTIVLFFSFILLLSTWLPYMTEVEAAAISDVPTSNAKYQAINWAVDNGLMSLYTGKKFDLNGNVSESEMLLAFAKLDANYKHSTTSDMAYLYYGDINIPLEGAANKAKRSRLATRGDFAVIYAAMRGLDLSKVHAVQYLYTQEITKGTSGKKTYEGFAPDKNINRGDLAVFLYRIAQNGKFAVEGLRSAATGKDNGKITLPLHFVASEGTSVDLEKPGQNTSDVSPNTPNANKAVQSVEVENKKLNANGYDVTMVTVKLKDSNGNAIPYDQSLTFKVYSEYFKSINFNPSAHNLGAAEKAKLKYDPKEILEAPTAVTSPNGTSTALVETDGGELTFFYRAPRMTKSMKDNIILELADSSVGKNFASYKNSQIKIPVEYTVEPELRISYEVYDGQTYAGGDGGGQIPSAPAYPADVMKQGPITVSNINADAGTLTVQSVNIMPQYRYARLTLAQREISEQMFERIVSDLLDNTSTIQLDYYVDANGNAAYNIPFSYIPGSIIKEFGSNEPQEYAVLLYLFRLLPDKISEFSMADYKSVKSAQAIAQRITEADIRNSSYKDLRNVINGIDALAKLADQTKAAEDAASRPGDMPSYTKVVVTLVAPGGQVITNYNGQVTIDYNGQKKTVPFNRTQGTSSEDSGRAIAYFDGAHYGKTVAKVTFSPETDSRYKELLKGLEGKVVKKEIIAHPPLNTLESCNRIQKVAFVVDESGSMKKADPNNLINKKTRELMEELNIEPTVAAGFNSQGRFIAKDTGEKVSKLEELYELKYRKGGTKIATGIEAAKQHMKEQQYIGSIPGAIVLVSDGKANSNEAKDIITYAQQNNLKVFTVSVGKDANQTILKNIAVQTEGQHFHLSDINNITAIYESLMKAMCINLVEACPPNFDSFQQSDVTIGRTYLFIEAEANCGNVEKVKVKFYSVKGEIELDLRYIGMNRFELEHDIRKIHNFSIYEEVEFLAYDKDGKLLATKKIDIQ